MSGAGARSRATGSGTSRWTSVPAGTIMFARSGMPSAVRRPSEMSFWTWLRDRPVTSATYRSIRPIRPSGTRRVRTPAAIGASGIDWFRGLAGSRTRWPASVDAVEPEPPRQQRARQQQQDRARDGTVGDVERVEAQVAQAGVHEVDDVAQPQPVEHVAEGTPE